MQKFIDKVHTLSKQELYELLLKDLSSKELIEILKELFLLDPKIDSGLELFDCCGTGGDAANTFNISTTTAILAAAAGIKTGKNGGRSSTSQTGSVDVLEELGVNFQQSLEVKLIGLKKFGLAFHNSKAIAETLAPLKNYARQNKISSFLSLLGPFTNPFLLKGQIIGIGKKEWFENVCELARFNLENGYCKRIALIQSESKNGQIFDELTSVTKAKIKILSKNHEFDFDFDPRDFDLTPNDEVLLQGASDHQGNAKILKSILANQANSCQVETSLINLALLMSLDQDLSKENIKALLKQSYKIAKTNLESGESLRNWQEFLSYNQAKN